MRFNRRPFQLLRSYKRHEEKNKNKLDRNVAPCSRRLSMSSAHSMNARKCVHAQKPYPRHQYSLSKSPIFTFKITNIHFLNHQYSLSKSPIFMRMNQARSEEEEKERKRDRGQEADESIKPWQNKQRYRNAFQANGSDYY